jgi:hypothetical protein
MYVQYSMTISIISLRYELINSMNELEKKNEI